MKVFPGFSPRTRFTPLPEAFFSLLLPEMEDPAEIKTVLYVFRALCHKPGYPRFVTQGELAAEQALQRSVGSPERLQAALQQAVKRGILLHLTLQGEGQEHKLYFLNDEPSRQAVARIQQGQLSLGGLMPVIQAAPAEEKRNIFTLYEENIGLLTPLIAEELQDAEKLYPASWIEAAFKEAVAQNKHSWKYIARILEDWAREGRGDGTAGRHPTEEPVKYAKDKYGRFIRY